MTGTYFLQTPEMQQWERDTVLSDLRSIQDLRLFLKSSQRRLKILEHFPQSNTEEIEREKAYIDCTLKEIQRLERLITLKGWRTC
jgi:hypothetical protein